MPKKPLDPVSADEIDAALQAAPAEQALNDAVERNPPLGPKGSKELDLEMVQDAILVQQDDRVNSRLLQVISTLRLLDTLRRTPQDDDARFKQAQLSLAYIKHSESLGRKSEKLDPRKKDAGLAKAVAEVRTKLTSITEYKAAAAAKAADEGA